MTPVEATVRARVARHGSVPFDEVMELALYDPDAGFYASGGRAGRRGDFLTSPEVGPLFGAVVARALDQWWREAGQPSVFVVVEAGAGPGTLARAVLDARPACASALRYVLVERSARQRATQAGRLALENPATAFAAVPDPDDDEPAVEPPPGPIAVALAELPRLSGPCVVLANELLDNLPFALAEQTVDGWAEVQVGAVGEELREVLVPLPDTARARLDELAPEAPVGGRVPLAHGAASWVRDAVELAGPGGRVVTFDYGRRTADLAAVPWRDWLRTYRQHERGDEPLAALGEQDVTGEVPLDQLDPAPDHDALQGEWLRAHGIDELVEQGRRTWQERAAIGDLEAIRGRSRVTEAEALLDPSGLGAFRVLEWRP